MLLNITILLILIYYYLKRMRYDSISKKKIIFKLYFYNTRTLKINYVFSIEMIKHLKLTI